MAAYFEDFPLAWNPLYLGTFDEAVICLAYNNGNWVDADTCDGVPDAMIVGRILQREFRSPFAAPYGGLLILGEDLDARECLSDLVSHLFAQFEIDTFSVRITASPIFRGGLAHEDLIDICTRVTFEPTFLVDTASWTPDLLSSGNRKRFRQSVERRMTSHELDASHVDAIHETLTRNRDSIGAQMPVTRDRLRRQVASLPDRYSLHATFSDDEMVASAVVVELLPGIAYVFMWGENPMYRSWSPVVPLFIHIVDWARKKGYCLLDLGTASLGGAPNIGLVRFKRNLGATEANLADLNFVQ